MLEFTALARYIRPGVPKVVAVRSAFNARALGGDITVRPGRLLIVRDEDQVNLLLGLCRLEPLISDAELMARYGDLLSKVNRSSCARVML
jgi:hypothetical protein